MITTRRAALLVVIGESLITPVVILPVLLFDNFAPALASVHSRMLLAALVTVVGATVAFFLYVYHANGEIPHWLGFRVAALVAACGMIAMRAFLMWPRINPGDPARWPDFIGALALGAFFIAAAWESAFFGTTSCVENCPPGCGCRPSPECSFGTWFRDPTRDDLASKHCASRGPSATPAGAGPSVDVHLVSRQRGDLAL